MIKRIFALVLVAVTALILLYLSRFWIFEWWGREGLFGISDLRPQGGLLGRWLSGTPFAPFELLIWVCGSFYAFTWLERLLTRFNKHD